MRQQGPSGNQILVIGESVGWGQSVFGCDGKGQTVSRNVGNRWSARGGFGAAHQRRWKLIIRELLLWRAQEESIRCAVGGGELLCLREIGTRSAVGVYDPFGKQILRKLSVFGNVRGKDVVIAAVFTDDHDDMFNGRGRVSVVALLRRGRGGFLCLDGTDQRPPNSELEQGKRRQAHAQIMH